MWVFGRSGGPFFLKNGIEANNYFMLKRLQLLRISQTIFMIDSLKEISVYHFSHYMYCGSSPTDTANNLMILCNYACSLSYLKRGDVCGAGTVALYMFARSLPFLFEAVQPLYLDSGNHFIIFMSIYSDYRYICK